MSDLSDYIRIVATPLERNLREQIAALRAALAAAETERDEAAFCANEHLTLRIRAIEDRDGWRRHAQTSDREVTSLRAKVAALEASTTAQGIYDVTTELIDVRRERDDAHAALRPFAEFAEGNVDECGWTDGPHGCQKERIVDWFGPSDFRAALRATETGDA